MEGYFQSFSICSSSSFCSFKLLDGLVDLVGHLDEVGDGLEAGGPPLPLLGGEALVVDGRLDDLGHDGALGGPQPRDDGAEEARLGGEGEAEDLRRERARFIGEKDKNI